MAFSLKFSMNPARKQRIYEWLEHHRGKMTVRQFEKETYMARYQSGISRGSQGRWSKDARLGQSGFELSLDNLEKMAAYSGCTPEEMARWIVGLDPEMPKREIAVKEQQAEEQNLRDVIEARMSELEARIEEFQATTQDRLAQNDRVLAELSASLLSLWRQNSISPVATEPPKLVDFDLLGYLGSLSMSRLASLLWSVVEKIKERSPGSFPEGDEYWIEEIFTYTATPVTEKERRFIQAIMRNEEVKLDDVQSRNEVLTAIKVIIVNAVGKVHSLSELNRLLNLSNGVK